MGSTAQRVETESKAKVKLYIEVDFSVMAIASGFGSEGLGSSLRSATTLCATLPDFFGGP